MRLELLEPDGELTPQLVSDALSLVSHAPWASAIQLADLTCHELLLVFDWASREMMDASDNHIRRRPMPVVLRWAATQPVPGERDDDGETVHWTCAHVDSTGALDCGEAESGVSTPDSQCCRGHHPSYWRSTKLWRCCDELCYGDVVPKHPCPNCETADRWTLVAASGISASPGDVASADASSHDVAPPTIPRDASAPPRVVRRRLPAERRSVTRRFRLSYSRNPPSELVGAEDVDRVIRSAPDAERVLRALWMEVQDARSREIEVMRLYFTASTYEDGSVGEVFVKANRTGSLASGALDAVATLMSMMLQYGVPLPEVLSKLRRTRYEPSGFTGDSEFPLCTSPLDLLAQWLERRFGSES